LNGSTFLENKNIKNVCKIFAGGTPFLRLSKKITLLEDHLEGQEGRCKEHQKGGKEGRQGGEEGHQKGRQKGRQEGYQ